LRQILLIGALAVITLVVHGQTLKGIVVDGSTSRPLTPVGILDLAGGQSTITDSGGNFTLAVTAGDRIAFSCNGYHTIDKIASFPADLYIELFPLSVQLPEYTLHDYTPYQRDSAEMAELYGKELNTKPVKVGFSNADGGGFTGLIGAPVQKMSRSYKRNKRFKENFKKDQEQKYIDSRYKPELVTALTGLTGDTLIHFMNSYPMEYAFARAATDLELKAWIRDNYREYIKARAIDAPVQKNTGKE